MATNFAPLGGSTNVPLSSPRLRLPNVGSPIAPLIYGRLFEGPLHPTRLTLSFNRFTIFPYFFVDSGYLLLVDRRHRGPGLQADILTSQGLLLKVCGFEQTTGKTVSCCQKCGDCWQKRHRMESAWRVP